MENVDIYHNPKHFSLYIKFRILGWEEEAIEMVKQDKQEEAIHIYNSMIDIYDQIGSLYANRGIALYEIGDIENAIIDFKKALSINHENSLAIDMLAIINEEKKELDFHFNYLTLEEIISRGIDECEIQKRIDEGKLQGVSYEGEMLYHRQNIVNCL